MFSATAPGDLDGSGTINPASLGPSSVYSPHLSTTQHHPFSPPATATSEYAPDIKSTVVGTVSPRGIKRSHSPDHNNSHSYNKDGSVGDAVVSEEPVRRKRGRPPKNKGIATANAGPANTAPQSQQHASLPHQQQVGPLPPIGTPHLQNVPLQISAVTSPPKPKTTTLKALPTVRDHTTDQLNPEGDEYMIRENDEAGDQKVMPTGHLRGGREYKCKTFNVPNRGDKLFMLATECARVLGYRDSYLLFNKNKSLHKIIATQAEKDDLISQELLPYSYRSRQIAIVTARSMFRQFGSRVIVNGRRVRDDYWENKARKQGFTEDDPAGEKRPGAAKQRAAQQAANAAQQVQQQQAQQQPPQPPPPQTSIHSEYLSSAHDVSLDNPNLPQTVQPGHGGPSQISQTHSHTLPMIQEDRTSRELYNIPRPRQEITGAPYQDRIPSVPMSQMMDHAQQTADFNKTLGQTREIRKQNYTSFYNQKRSPPPQQQASSPPMPHHPGPGHSLAGPPPQHSGATHQMHPPPPMMSLNHPQHAQHAQPQHVQHPGMMPRPSQGIKPDQIHNSSPAPGGYLPPQAYYAQHSPPAQQPGHPVHPQQQTPQRQMSHPQMSPIHQSHPGQQPMYQPSPAGQSYMQQHQQSYSPHMQQGYRPQPSPQHQTQQQWWSGP